MYLFHYLQRFLSKLIAQSPTTLEAPCEKQRSETEILLQLCQENKFAVLWWTVPSQMSCGSAVVCAGSAPTGCISRCRGCRAERNLQMEVDTKEAGYQISGGDAHRSASRCSYATNSNAILSGPQRERRYEKMWPDLSYSQHNNMLRGLCQLLQWALLQDCGWRDWTKILSQTNGSLWRCKASHRLEGQWLTPVTCPRDSESFS